MRSNRDNTTNAFARWLTATKAPREKSRRGRARVVSIHMALYDLPIDRGDPTLPTVTISPKFQVVIPLEIRRAMGLKAGEKVEVFRFRNRLELVPVRGIATMRGFLKGIDTTIVREPDRV